MAQSPVGLAQTKYLMNGGPYELALAQMRDKGTMPEAGSHPYQEYPKAIRVSHGTEDIPRETDTCKGTVQRWTETREKFEDIIVHSEDEEERVLAGGKTSVQIEADRAGLINRCHSLSIPVDPSWSVVRLRRELGEALDAPAPQNEMARLEAELDGLRKIEALQAEIAALKAKQAAREPDEPIEELGDSKKRQKVAA